MLWCMILVLIIIIGFLHPILNFLINFSPGIAGFAVNQMVSKRAELFVNPQFKYVFTPTFNEKYPVVQHQLATGLRMGIKLHL